MRLPRRFALPALLLLAPALLGGADPLAWPTPTTEMHPWTRWWWLGSAVDKEDLTRQLTLFRDAGIGGVEICPIYGAKGYEKQFIDFLSPEWMAMLAHTTTEAARLGLGVDLTTGTGWPFGGPFVSPDDASSGLILKRYEVAGGAKLGEPLPAGSLQCLLAVSDGGERIDLTVRVRAGALDWVAPAGSWKLYAAVQSGPVQKVKRAAPGGAGDVLDPYSVKAMSDYLAVFDRAFAGYHAPMPRAQFHDSFEYYGATWTADFFAQFAARRGYDLRTQLPALAGDGPADTVARVKYDYRVTIAELHEAYMARWTEWAHTHGELSRDQAHGAPCNLVDLYATADIPETEIFGSVADSNVVMNKLSSSAAHLAGRRLASSESFTWLNEPFQATLSQVKQAADYLLLTGVNHIFFHGIPYSPAAAPWPGWQFYAAVNFGPAGGLWRNLPEFNAYVTRCQSVLQQGAPANDVLLYFPLADIWQVPDGLLMPFTIHNVREWLGPRPFFATATTLWNRGYGYDVVSDHFLAAAQAADRGVAIGGNHWKVVLVPDCRLMPLATLRHLLDLARDGATVLMQGELPTDVPGWHELGQRRTEFRALTGGLAWAEIPGSALRRAAVGRGAVIAGTDVEALLQAAGVAPEPMADMGIWFVRRAGPDGYTYFLANRSEQPVAGWVSLGVPARSAVLLDPMDEHRRGLAELRSGPGGATQIRLQLAPGASRILRTITARSIEGTPWPYRAAAGPAQPIAGTWAVKFIDGGPALPAAYETTQLASWTDREDPEAKRFAGTARYTIEFERPAGAVDDWLLDLGQVEASARVTLNGHPLDGFWCAPFQAPVGRWLQPGRNTLQVEVTNLAANRIRDLDQRKVNWKYFYDANVLTRNYRPLDASSWPLFPSGLLGPVTLTPLTTPAPR